MAALRLKNDDVAATYAYLRHHHKGWVKNRLVGKSYSFVSKGKSKFAAIAPNFHDGTIKLKGSFTDGKSGFSFIIEANLKGNKSPSLRITRHADCSYSESNIHDIIFDLIITAKNKLTGEEKSSHERFKEPMLKAHKKNDKISQRNRENIEHFHNTGYFDKEFKTFLLQHEMDGIRCCRKR